MNLRLFAFLTVFLFYVTDINAQFKKDSTYKAFRVAAMPMINYNRTQGIIVGAMTQVYYKVNKSDTISPASSTGIIGIYIGVDVSVGKNDYSLTFRIGEVFAR